MDQNDQCVSIVKSIDKRNSVDLRIYPSIVMIVLLVFIAVSWYFILFVGSGESRDRDLSGITVTGLAVLISLIHVNISRIIKHNNRDKELMLNLVKYSESIGLDSKCISAMRCCALNFPTFKEIKVAYVASLVPAVFGILALMFNLNHGEGFTLTVILMLFSLLFSFIVMVMTITYPREHEKNFVNFSDNIVEAFSKKGIKIDGYEPAIGYRPLPLLIVLTVITLGFFFPLWIYLSIRDMNRHFDEQWKFENSVLDAITY